MIREQAIEATGIYCEGPAYQAGWEDGRFGKVGCFVANPSLASWTEHFERLAYYRGHRDGCRVRETLGAAEQQATA